MQNRNYVTCHCCGKKAEYTECSDMSAPPDDARCKVLDGWLTVSYWTGLRSINHYDFCSFNCLQKWLESQVPRVPDTFLEAFGEE